MVKWHLTKGDTLVYYFKYVGEVPLGLLFFCINLPSVWAAFFMEKRMIPDNYKPIRQVGNGNTVSFAFDFPLISENFVEVYREKNGTQSVVGRNEYSVSMTNNGGNVVFNTAPSKGEIIVITRRVPLEQDTPYKTSSGFPAVRVEENFDAQIAIAQQLQEQIDRCVKVEVTGDKTPEALLDEVYNKLDSATEVAEQAIGAANQATTAAKDAKDAVVVAQQQITETQAFVEQARADINQTVEESIEYVEQEAVKAATEVVGEVVGQYTNRAETAAKNAEADALRTAESANKASASATSAATSASEASSYNFKNKITNCITEIPQDIKLELNNGTLTLKAGSKVYVPNGAGKFDVVNVTADITVRGASTSSGAVRCLYYINGQLGIYAANSSGTTPPTSGTNQVFYNTSDNTIKVYANGSVVKSGYSLPIARIKDDGVYLYGAIDQVFNGFGYIGNTLFALPNVKGLIPDGRNTDGSLKNIEFVVDTVKTRTLSANMSNRYWFLWKDNANNFHFTAEYYISDTQPVSTAASARWYNPKENKTYAYSTSQGKWIEYNYHIYLGFNNFTTDSSARITSFTPKLPFRAVDQNDFNKLDEEVVKTSGDQTMYGTKRWLGLQRVWGLAKPQEFKSPDIDLTTPPSANKSMLVDYLDKNGTRIGVVGAGHYPSGKYIMYLQAANIGSMGIGVNTDGKVYTEAPTPVSSDNSRQIATTEWVTKRVPAIMNTPINETSLFSGNVDSGDIALSEPFTNFEQLLIIGSDDAQTCEFREVIPTKHLNDSLNTGYNRCFLINGNLHWTMSTYTNGSTTTLFKGKDNNCRIKDIKGLNRK